LPWRGILGQLLVNPNDLQAEAWMIPAAVMTTAARETGNALSGWMHPLMTLTAHGTAQQEVALEPACFERKLMSPLLAGYAKIAARLAPLVTMRGESATAIPVLGHEMSQLVQQCQPYLPIGNGSERRIEPDFPSGGNGHAGGRAHPGIPADHKMIAESRRHRSDDIPRLFFKHRISLFVCPSLHPFVGIFCLAGE